MGIVISVILLFLGIGILVLIHVCIVGTVRNVSSEGNINMVESRGLGSTSLSRDDIEKLPCFDFKGKENGSSPGGDCAVCLENYRVGEKCRVLPSCNHSFHAECVDLWLLRTPVCPICRAVALADVMGSGLVYGIESNRFSESGVREMRENSRDEIGIEIGGVEGGESESSSGNVVFQGGN